MLRGRITSEDDAKVEIILIFKGVPLRRDAVVDTGFNGYISIPRELLIGTKLLSGQLCEFDYGSRIVRIRKGNILR